MPQFFIKSVNVKGNYVEIDDKNDLRHIAKVLRFKVGDEIIFVDEGQFLYISTLELISEDFLRAKIIHKEKSSRVLDVDITVFQSLLKSNAQDFLIQKVTELGVNKIVPIISDYTVVKFKNLQDRQKKIDRWKKIADESCKQCERSKKPELNCMLSFTEAIDLDFDIKIACVERCSEKHIKSFLAQNKYVKGQKLALFIGPEGGWSDKELDSFSAKKIVKVSLGNMILRAETAAISAVSNVVYEYEN